MTEVRDAVMRRWLTSDILELGDRAFASPRAWGGVIIPVSLTFLFLVSCARLRCRVRGARLSIDVNWKQEECRATLARLRQVDSFRCAEPR